MGSRGNCMNSSSLKIPPLLKVCVREIRQTVHSTKPGVEVLGLEILEDQRLTGQRQTLFLLGGSENLASR